ncbi:MSHA biogenesis protein MshJ [Halorhodospira halochloris]|uniref:MSHA biogenesis protein MshJ n=1 Tax=Halorhodospira halochloris TaxID=1052 RepID=A0A110B589_HALHR|nr:type II secretion system protein GspM [Halorhodospira halochloris]MBK1651102.1 hypothetical protein [Halorhodospira halochloris]BAU57368.1 MSHA biogenesis protein MshJ [Halorhodospira halochloris]
MAAPRTKIKTLLQPVVDAIEQRTTRERVLLLGAAIALVGALWYYGSYQPTQQRINTAQTQLTEVKSQVEELRSEKQSLEEDPIEDPDDQLRAEIAELEDELEELHDSAAADIPSFIQPQMMRRVLEEILAERSGADLVSLQRMPPELAIKPDEENDSATPEVFRHRIELVIEADFMSTIDYLEELEDLPWQFAWEMIDYQVIDHPRARVKLRLHTLSGHRQWLGL